MNVILASLAFVALAAVSLIHLAWAMGSTFPCKDEKTLAQTVAGFRGIDKMPPRLASLLVALVAFAVGILALAMADLVFAALPNLPLVVVACGASAVFTLRGLLGYTRFWRTLTPMQPFARLDMKFYAPLCLALGLDYFILALERLT